MSHMSLILYIYAGILLGGGVAGYAKAKSTPSLIAGAVSAVIAGIAAAVYPDHNRTALGIALLLSAALIAVFARRYTATKNPMPAIPMIVVSALVLLVSIYGFVKAQEAAGHSHAAASAGP